MGAHRKLFYDDALKMYQQGMSVGEVAEFYGVTRQAMWEGLRLRGCEFRDQLKFGEENHFHRGTKADGRTHNITEKAIKRGVLIQKDTCEECGASGKFKDGRAGIHAHHDDYNKPLEVRWLCYKCHHSWHKTNQAIPRISQ